MPGPHKHAVHRLETLFGHREWGVFVAPRSRYYSQCPFTEGASEGKRGAPGRARASAGGWLGLHPPEGNHGGSRLPTCDG